MLQLQRQAGNAAVAAAVQRQLLLEGPPADVTAVLQMLQTASGLALKHDRTSKEVTIVGTPGSTRSSELTARLQAILTDATRVARVQLRRTGQEIWFGKFPEATFRGAQEVRVDHVVALEQAVPGAGVSTLAHEIIENFEAQTVAKDDWRHAHSTVHPTAVAAGDKILEQLQRSAGGALSGGRLNSYIAVVKTAGKGEKNLRVEAYQNDFIVYEIVTSAKGEKLIVTRVASKTLDASRVAGFTAKTTALPPASAAGVRKAAALLTGDPTATAVLGATATKADVPKAADWNEMVRLAIVAQMPSDVILRSSDRFREEPVRVGTVNEVAITVRRPDRP